jgi:hypothetical protein
MERDIQYENRNIGFDEQYPEEKGGGIKCKNHELCRAVLPKWWFECKGHYLCINCHMMFGTWSNQKANVYKTGKGVLDISDNIECPICLEKKRSISQPNCLHTLCIDCFKRCYYGDDVSENEPEFPYPDIEDDYYEDPRNPKWETEYPLIKIYNKDWSKWDNENYERYENEKALRKCPLCRK